MRCRWLLLFLLACAAGMAIARPVPANSVDREGDGLIASIGALKGASFIRNGAAHSASEAASHLQMKRRKAGKRIKAAEDFITLCATGSYLSGKPYRIRLADGTTVTSADFLRAQLQQIRAQATPPPK